MWWCREEMHRSDENEFRRGKQVSRLISDVALLLSPSSSRSTHQDAKSGDGGMGLKPRRPDHDLAVVASQ